VNGGEIVRLRSATAYELMDEPDGVLQGLVEGSILATEETRVLARQELDARRLRPEREKRRRGH